MIRFFRIIKENYEKPVECILYEKVSLSRCGKETFLCKKYYKYVNLGRILMFYVE